MLCASFYVNVSNTFKEKNLYALWTNNKKTANGILSAKFTYIDVLHISHLAAHSVELLCCLTHMVTVLKQNKQLSKNSSQKQMKLDEIHQILTRETTLLVMTPPNKVFTVFFWEEQKNYHYPHFLCMASRFII